MLFADGTERQLDPRFIPLQRLVGFITTAVLSLGGFAGVVIYTLVEWFHWSALALLVVWAGISAGLAWMSYVWPEREYEYTRYRIDDHGIQIRTGVFWRAVINVPRSRVQHTDVAQGPLERNYGLGTLSIYTAGTDHAKVSLPGLAHEDALALRDHLLPREASDAV